MTKRPKIVDVGGIQVEIGPPVSTDGGLVFVARHLLGLGEERGILVALTLLYALLGAVDIYLLFKFAKKGPAEA